MDSVDKVDRDRISMAASGSALQWGMRSHKMGSTHLLYYAKIIFLLFYLSISVFALSEKCLPMNNTHTNEKIVLGIIGLVPRTEAILPGFLPPGA